MIEKVARAIFSANTGTPYYEAHHPAFENEQEHWETLAKAAIEAMRDPTDGVIREGWHELRKHNEIQTRLGNSLVGVETPVYRAMINAALDGL